MPVRRILVTGGAGYIGSHTVRQLLREGHDVTVADNLSKGHDWAVPPKATFVEVDVLDGPALTEVVGDGFDGVLHFAALSLVGESVGEPARYFRTNVGGTLNLLDAVRAAGVERLVFSSTAATYGEPDEVPILETAPTVPTNPYGASKLAVDMAIGFECAAAAGRGQSFGATSLRYFNVAGACGDYGAGSDGHSGEQQDAGTDPAAILDGHRLDTPLSAALARPPECVCGSNHRGLYPN